MVPKEVVTEICARLSNDCSNQIVDTTAMIAQKCNLDELETGAVAVILSEMISDIVAKSMDLCIELCKEESRQ
jgi:hypothetical protein